jgi:TonB family protein
MSFGSLKSVLVGVLVALTLPWSPSPGPFDNSPKVLKSQLPIYPVIAYMAHASGTVVVEVEITQDGNVAAVKEISGPPLLRSAVRTAALAWRFESSTEPVRSTQLRFDFVHFDDPGCRLKNDWITPYHAQVYRTFSDTISLDPEDVQGHSCEIHRVPLVKDRVEINYGLVEFRSGYLNAEKKFFPNAHSKAFGGCVLEAQTYCDGTTVQTSPRFQEVLYCPKCRRAEMQWSKKNSNKPFRS